MRVSLTGSHFSSSQSIPQSSNFWRKVEHAIILICLLLFTEALLGRVFASEDSPDGSPILRLMWLPVYAYASLQILLRWRDMFSIAIRSPGLVLLSFLAMASMAWSIDPSTSLRRGFAIIGTTAFGFYIACALSWKEMLRMIGLCWLILAIGNFIAGAAIPSFGVMHEIHPGAWRGLWFEKNTLGGMFARASFLFGFLALVDLERRKTWSFALFLSIALVLFSTSKTSLLGLLLGVGLLFAFLVMRRGFLTTVSFIWIGFSMAGLLVLLVVLAPELLVGIIGRDLTLTGRTDIWTVLLNVISERPLLGYGYGAFWGEDSAPAHTVRLETDWPVPTAHNGLLEIMLSLGIVGAILFIIDYLVNIMRSTFTIHLKTTSLYAFGFILIFTLFAISESIIFKQNSITWVTYSALTGKLALDARERMVKRREKRTVSREIRVPAINEMRGRLKLGR